MTYFEGAAFLIVLQLFVFAVLHIRTKKTSGALLGLLLILFIDQIRIMVFNCYISHEFSRQLAYNIHTDVLIGPVLYLYLRSIKEGISFRKILAHVAFPLVFILSALGIAYLAYSGLIAESFVAFTEIRIAIFLLYAVWILKKFSRQNWEFLRYAGRYRLLFFAVFFYMTFYYFDTVLYDYWYNFREGLRPAYSYLEVVLFISFSSYLIYYGATELNWLKKLIVHSDSTGLTSETVERYKKINADLQSLFGEQKVHTDSKLDAEQLSRLLGIGKAELSDFLQAYKHANFYELLNTWRVEEFKRKIEDPKYSHLDILGVAFEAGFGSKATFNRAFKRIEGMTPNQYRKKLKQNA